MLFKYFKYAFDETSKRTQTFPLSSANFLHLRYEVSTDQYILLPQNNTII